MDQRRADRQTATAQVNVRIGDERFGALLYNLSRSGCMFERFDGKAALGAAVQIELLPDVLAAGKVIWSQVEGLGVRFDDELGELTVRHFALTGWNPSLTVTPLDRFGRSLPALCAFKF